MIGCHHHHLWLAVVLCFDESDLPRRDCLEADRCSSRVLFPRRWSTAKGASQTLSVPQSGGSCWASLRWWHPECIMRHFETVVVVVVEVSLWWVGTSYNTDSVHKMEMSVFFGGVSNTWSQSKQKISSIVPLSTCLSLYIIGKALSNLVLYERQCGSETNVLRAF